MRDYPDGPLGKLCQRRLVVELIDEARVGPADGLLVFHTSGYQPDHAAALLPQRVWNCPFSAGPCRNRSPAG